MIKVVHDKKMTLVVTPDPLRHLLRADERSLPESVRVDLFYHLNDSTEAADISVPS